MTVEGFNAYAATPEGQLHPMAGTVVDDIVRAQLAGDQELAEMLIETEGAKLRDVFAAEEEWARLARTAIEGEKNA